jgi:hypothetical protein
MAHMLIHYPRAAVARPPAPVREARAVPRASDDDPLNEMRGILFGVAVSVLGFWLPLALILGG